MSEYYKVFIDNNETSTQDYGFVFSTDTDVITCLNFREQRIYSSLSVSTAVVYMSFLFPDKKEIKEDGKIKQTIIEVIKLLLKSIVALLFSFAILQTPEERED